MLAANRRQALKPLLPRPVSVRQHLPLPALLGLALCPVLCLVWMLPSPADLPRGAGEASEETTSKAVVPNLFGAMG